MTNESERAIAEAELMAACDEYFGARPQLVSIHNKRIFEKGFRLGWDRRDTVGVSRVDNVCPNCDSPLPGGCEGRFSNEHECMWRKT